MLDWCPLYFAKHVRSKITKRALFTLSILYVHILYKQKTPGWKAHDTEHSVAYQGQQMLPCILEFSSSCPEVAIFLCHRRGPSCLDIFTGDMEQQKQQHISVITADANIQTWLLLRQFMKMIYKCVRLFMFWVQCKYPFSHQTSQYSGSISDLGPGKFEVGTILFSLPLSW